MTKRHLRMKRALVAASLAVTTSVPAASLAINFKGDAYGNEFGRDVSQTAFGVAAGDWFTSPNHDAGTGDGGTDSATLDGVLLSWTFNNDWAQSNAYAGTTGEDEVYFGYLDDGGSGVDITVAGLGAWLGANGADSYSITIAMTTGQGAGGSLLDTPLLDSNGGASLGTFSVPSDPGGSGGFQGSGTIAGLTSDTLFIDGQARAGAARGSIGGIIITPVPEPSGAALFGLAGLTLLARRRRS